MLSHNPRAITGWAIALCSIALIAAACLIFGASAVSALFEALLYGVAWVIAVWAVLLGLA